MTYSDFINKVTSLLLYDSIEDDEEHASFINQHVRAWMSKMQYYVPNFKVKNINSYREADVTPVCEGATIDLPVTLEKLTRVEFIRPDDYPKEIVVASAGTAAANGTYTIMDGSDADTRPTYEFGIYTISWSGTAWELSDGTDILYNSSDDVVSPDLVTTWAPVVPEAIVVEGAGTVAANVIYFKDGDNAGKDSYSKVGSFTGVDSVTWSASPAEWHILVSSSVVYNSADDVATPDLATTWNIDTGDAPVPTVRVAIASDFGLAPIPVVTRGNACDNTIAMTPTNYDDRDELIRTNCKYSGCFKYAIDRRATELTVYPAPDEDYTYGPEYIKVTWEGTKNDYDGLDVIPFTEDTVENCADYLNARLARKKEDKLANYNSYYKSYEEGRREIALAQRNKSQQRA